MNSGNFIKSKLFKIIVGLVSLLIICSAAYFIFFSKKEIKRELLASIYVTPNDTSETIIKFKEEITFNIPKGEIKNPDTLSIYNVKNIDKPEHSEELVKVYDLKFGKTNKFKNPIAVEISYSDIAGDKKIDNENCLHLMNYDEKNKNWSEVNAELDKEQKKLVFYAEHFSSYGVVYDITNPHPMMKVTTWKRPSTLQSLPDISKSQIILESSSGGNPSKAAESSGYAMVVEAFNFSAALTSLAEEITGTEIFEKFNKFAGEFGLLISLKQFAFEIIEGKTEQAKLNMCKNLMMYSLGKWGNQAMRISNIGMFFIDYSLTKFGEKGIEVREKKYQDIYDNFNKHHNVYKKDKDGWVKFILGVVASSGDVKSATDYEMNKYLFACFNEEGSMIPKDVEEILVNKERFAVLDILHDALKEAAYEIDELRKKEILGVMGEMKDLLNKEFPINVIVYGDEKEIKGLPVRIVVGKDQNLWEGKTDNAGQWWDFRCTWLGYLYYKKPTVVELEYDGKILRENFVASNSGVTVRFYLPKKEDVKQESGEFEFAGNYSGTYSSIPNPQCVIQGTVSIQVNPDGSAIVTASGSGGCKYSDWSSKEIQTFKLKGDKAVYVKKTDAYNIYCVGTETKTVTYINAAETTTKSYQWDDRNHSIHIFRDGTLKAFGPYFKIEAKK